MLNKNIWVIALTTLWLLPLARLAANEPTGELFGVRNPTEAAALKAIETKRQAAIKAHDFDTLRTIYAEDFVGIAGNGTVLSRSDLMDIFARNDGSLTFSTDEVSIWVLGDTALFMGRLTARTAAGEVASAGRFTHVFFKRAGTWLCIHGQSTPIPK